MIVKIFSKMLRGFKVLGYQTIYSEITQKAENYGYVPEMHTSENQVNIFFSPKVHAIAPSEDNKLIEHLEELIQELGPLSEEDLEEEAVDEEDVENELQRESDEEEMDTS